MEKDIVSIIVPIYNCEKDIERTIESIIKQSYNNIEIILVNDGSTDNSAKVVEEYRKIDKRIKVIHQKNAGVSAARNTGLDVASGNYIAFIDADDYIEQDYIKTLYEQAKKNNCDIVKCCFKRNDKDVQYFPELKLLDLTTQQDLHYLEKEMFETFKFNQVWGQLINKDVIKQNRFDIKLKMGEDYLFNYFIYKNTKKMLIIPECLYYYSINTSGMANSDEPRKIIRKIEDILELYAKIYDNNVIVLKRVIKEVIPHLLSALKSKKMTKVEKREIFEKIITNELIEKLIDNVEISTFKDYKYKYIVKCIYKKDYKKAYIYANSIYKMIKFFQRIIRR